MEFSAPRGCTYDRHVSEPAPARAARAARATILDVARAAGVSVTTVSHALNDKGTISPTTRARVVAAARELHYRPHPVAAGLRGGRTGVIGLDIRPLDALGDYTPVGVDHFLRFAGAAAVTALGHGIALMLVPDLSRDAVPASSVAVDGYIISDPVDDDPVLGRLLEQGRFVVTVGRDPGRPSFPHWVNTDDSTTARLVLDLLHARGARRAAVVIGTDDNSWNRDVADACRQWSAEHSLPLDLHRVPEADGVEGGRRIGQQLLDRAQPPDAVFCQTGRHAAGVCAAAAATGTAIPRDLMVVAGSDSEHTRGANPAITAIDLIPEQLGQAAVDMLLRLVAGEQVDQPVLLLPQILERATTHR